jgi:NADH-quinone oxidoreductase subunit G
VGVGEAFGMSRKENCMNKLVSALKIMGADEVYDTIFGADLTVREEGDEFLRRLESGKNLPLMTSCCPAWVRYVEQERPQFLKNLSSALSPMQMFATVLKDRYLEKDKEDGRTTYHIAIMPCTAKKMEAARPEFRRFGVPNVDLVLTTQEIIKMIKESGIRFQQLEKESPDLPFGMGSGAAEIFGATGGVAEAVVRHCLPDKSKNGLRYIRHSGLRGSEPIRFATVRIGERDVRIAVVHGLANAARLLDQIEAGEVELDLVEVMSCRTGCVGGAGQPYALMSGKLGRAEGLYEIDRSAMFKRAERNPVLNTMYAEDLGERSHELLHQTYSE